MNKLKKLLSSTFICCVAASTLVANAEAANIPEVVNETADIPFVDVLTPMSNSIEPYSVDRPTSFWNLENGNSYHGSFSGLGGLYTNYYFKPNSNGQLNFSISAVSEGSTEYLEVRCIKRGLGIKVDSFKTGPIGMTTQHFSKTFSKLNPDSDYYFQLIGGGYNRLSGDLLVWH